MKIQVEKTATFTGHKDCIYAMTPIANSTRFISAGSDGLVAEWDLDKPNEGKMIAKVENTVYALCHLPETNQLLVGQNFEGIHLIDLEKKQESKSIKLTDQAIFDIQFCNGIIYVASGKGTVFLLDLETFSIKQKLQFTEEHARTIALNPNWKEFAVGYSDNLIRVFSIENHQLKYELSQHTNSVFTLAYSTDSNLLLSGSRDAHLKIWSVANNYDLQESIVAHMYTINHIAYRADGKYFATCSKDKSIKIWDAHKLRLLKVIDKARHAGHGTSVNKLFWKDENTLVSASDDTSISVWNLEDLD
jgi:WD40 repeat protein